MYLVYHMIGICFEIFASYSFDDILDKVISSQSRRFYNMTIEKELNDIINTRIVFVLPILDVYSSSKTSICSV